MFHFCAINGGNKRKLFDTLYVRKLDAMRVRSDTHKHITKNPSIFFLLSFCFNLGEMSGRPNPSTMLTKMKKMGKFDGIKTIFYVRDRLHPQCTSPFLIFSPCETGQETHFWVSFQCTIHSFLRS